MKVRDMPAKIYEPGRLQMVWQQVTKSTGAAGIDELVFLHDFTIAFSRT
jgi:hypothetical protein